MTLDKWALLVTYTIPFTGEKINLEARKPSKINGCGVLQTPTYRVYRRK